MLYVSMIIVMLLIDDYTEEFEPIGGKLVVGNNLSNSRLELGEVRSVYFRSSTHPPAARGFSEPLSKIPRQPRVKYLPVYFSCALTLLATRSL